MSQKSNLQLYPRVLVGLLCVLALLECTKTTTVVASGVEHPANRGLRQQLKKSSGHLPTELEERTQTLHDVEKEILARAAHSNLHLFDPIVNLVNELKKEPSAEKVKESLTKQVESLLATDVGKSLKLECEKIIAIPVRPAFAGLATSLDPLVAVAHIVSLFEERIPVLIEKLSAVDYDFDRLAEDAEMFIDEFCIQQPVLDGVKTNIDTLREKYWIFEASSVEYTEFEQHSVQSLLEMVQKDQSNAFIIKIWMKRLQNQVKLLFPNDHKGPTLEYAQDQLKSLQHDLNQITTQYRVDTLLNVQEEFWEMAGGRSEQVRSLQRNDLESQADALHLSIEQHKILEQQMQKQKDSIDHLRLLVDKLRQCRVGTVVSSKLEKRIQRFNAELFWAKEGQAKRDQVRTFETKRGSPRVKQKLNDAQYDVSIWEEKQIFFKQELNSYHQSKKKQMVLNRVMRVLEDEKNLEKAQLAKRQISVMHSVWMHVYTPEELQYHLRLSTRAPEIASDAKLWWTWADFVRKKTNPEIYMKHLTATFQNDDVKLSKSIILTETKPSAKSLPAIEMRNMLRRWRDASPIVSPEMSFSILVESVHKNDPNLIECPGFAWWVHYNVKHMPDSIIDFWGQDKVLERLIFLQDDEGKTILDGNQFAEALKSFFELDEVDSLVDALQLGYLNGIPVNQFQSDSRLEILVRLLDLKQSSPSVYFSQLQKSLGEVRLQLMLTNEAVWFKCKSLSPRLRTNLHNCFVESWTNKLVSLVLRQDSDFIAKNFPERQSLVDSLRYKGGAMKNNVDFQLLLNSIIKVERLFNQAADDLHSPI
ncbi:hypothetical protein CCR75_009617 [Bremia lactucae]|uniref:Uncharacterized protein n=1 Tax=Bremia lactucae TaxID=4779 RepID=A0A976FI32_BRELC|nr:hypothetical protein CCR75_009617 [Bremia lactucae]